MSFRLLLLSTALCVAPMLASAQSPTAVDAVTVTASRLSLPAGQTPYSLAILPQAELAGRRSVADALGSLADVHVQTPGGRSGPASIFLRGADPNFTVVLLDGVPLNNSTNSRGGAVNVSEIDAAGFERVEIATGPLSSLYGSGSLAGVVNLVVAGGAQTHQFQATVGAGTRGHASGAGRWQGPLAGGLGGSLGLTVDDDGEQTEGARFKSKSLMGKVAPLGEADAGRLIFRLSETTARTFPDSSGGPRLAVIRDTDRRESEEQLLGLSVPVLKREGARLDLSAAYLNRRDDTQSPGVAPSAIDPFGIPAGVDSSRYRRVSAQAVARFDQADWTAVAGVEALREKGRSAGSLDFGAFQAPSNFDQQRDTVSAFVEAGRRATDWSVNTGLRLDDVEGLGQRVTARAGARYALGDTGLAVRGAVASGFKAPSFYALGNPFVGNRELGPERSLGGELGLVWTGDKGDASVTAFRTLFKGLIDFVPGPPPRLENRNLVTSEGVSASFRRALSPRLTSTVQASYAETTDNATGDQLLNRPKWRFSTSLTWTPTETVTLTARNSYVGKRNDYATPTGVQTLDAYGSLSLEGAWRFLPGTTARLVIDNALDDEHETAIGFPGQKVGARLFLNHSF
jgi:vitamin B12 transporter